MNETNIREYLNIMQLSESDLHDDILRKQYRKLSLTHHPDRGGTPESFQRLTNAYTSLVDYTKSNYNTNLRKTMSEPSPPTTDDYNKQMKDMDIFDFIFKKKTPKQQPKSNIETDILGSFLNYGINNIENILSHETGNIGSNFLNSIIPIEPLELRIKISYSECFEGCVVPAKIKRIIYKNSVETYEDETIYIDVYKGIDSGELIEFERKGNSDINGNRGILKVFVDLIENKNFKRSGVDLIYFKDISLKEALCGFKFVLNHLNGESYTLTCNSGEIITPTTEKVIPKLGFERGDLKGNLIIKFNIMFPKQLDSETICKIQTLNL